MGNPLFPPDKQPEPGGHALSVSMSNPLAGSFTFKGLQSGEYDSDLEAMFKKTFSLPRDQPYSYVWSYSDGGEVDQDEEDRDMSFGRDIIFPKVGEIPLDLPKQEKPEFTDEEKEILKKFPKNRQGRRAAMRRITKMREEAEERAKPVTVPIGDDGRTATYARRYTRDADGNTQCEYIMTGLSPGPDYTFIGMW